MATIDKSYFFDGSLQEIEISEGSAHLYLDPDSDTISCMIDGYGHAYESIPDAWGYFTLTKETARELVEFLTKRFKVYE